MIDGADEDADTSAWEESIIGLEADLGSKFDELEAKQSERDELIEAKRAEDEATLQALLDAADEAYTNAMDNMEELQNNYDTTEAAAWAASDAFYEAEWEMENI